MRPYQSALIVLLVVFQASGVAWATKEEKPPDALTATACARKMMSVMSVDDAFDKLDIDSDGRIAAVEAGIHPLPDAFWVLDRNQDGFLTPQEYHHLAH